MFHSSWLIIIALLGAVLCMTVMYVYSKGAFWCFHPLVLLFGLALLDTVVPAVLWVFSGIQSAKKPAEPLVYGDVVSGFGVYLVGYVVLIVSFSVLNVGTRTMKPAAVWILKPTVFWILLLLLLALAVLDLGASISEYGSLANWFAYKIKHRWDGKLVESTLPVWILMLSRFPSGAAFNLLVLIGFYHRFSLRHPILLGVLFPLIAIALACTTFFRGSILLLILGLGFVEFMRVKMSDVSAARIARSKAMKWAMLAVVLFLLYGLVRGELESTAWRAHGDSEPYLYKVINQGSGLRGVSYIVRNYGKHIEYLGGKTYIDMLLFPIPRSIYTTKPEWYGIDDITRGMGWRHSVQAAVTIPGEAFANFGWCGVVFVLPVFGMFFGITYRYCSQRGHPAMFLYPAVVMYMLFVSNWMAFTGIALRSIQFVVCLLLLKVLFHKKGRRPIHEAHRMTLLTRAV